MVYDLKKYNSETFKKDLCKFVRINGKNKETRLDIDYCIWNIEPDTEIGLFFHNLKELRYFLNISYVPSSFNIENISIYDSMSSLYQNFKELVRNTNVDSFTTCKNNCINQRITDLDRRSTLKELN